MPARKAKNKQRRVHHEYVPNKLARALYPLSDAAVWGWDPKTQPQLQYSMAEKGLILIIRRGLEALQARTLQHGSKLDQIQLERRLYQDSS